MGLAIDIELLCPPVPNWLKMNDTILQMDAAWLSNETESQPNKTKVMLYQLFNSY